MSKLLRSGTVAVWRIEPAAAPHVLRRCRRCDVDRPFRSSGRFRINAQGRRLDVWLVYRCAVCSASFNREVHARVSPESLNPERYQAYLRNDPEVANEVAFELQDAWTVEAPPHRLSCGAMSPAGVIRLEVPRPVAVRVDRILAEGLGLSRAAVRAAVAEGAIVIEGGPRTLRRPARDGLRIACARTVGSWSG